MKPEFTIERNGRQFVLYAGLLDEAHKQGLRRIATSLVQPPSDANGQVAIVYCEAETEKGCFSGLGDASPQNAARAMQTCLIRLAETRAKARALRDAVNVSACSVEELSGDEGAPAAPPAKTRPVAASPGRYVPASIGGR